MSPEWLALTPEERERRLRLAARCTAAAEEHRLWWAEEQARAALEITLGDHEQAVALLEAALGELRLLDPGPAS